MNNAITRKTRLINVSKNLLGEMKKNDNNVRDIIKGLKKDRSDNSELAYSLNVENRQDIKKMKKCEMLDSLNKKCSETASLYKSILGAYEKQSVSLQKIFNLLMKD